MTDFQYREGVLDGTGIATINVGGKNPPMVATLQSAAPGRKIEFCTIGAEMWQPIYDANTATMLNVAATAGLHSVKFTGAAGDLWNIR